MLPSEDELDSRIKLLSAPVDMDNKVNKITYQKSRLIAIILFLFINWIRGVFAGLFFNPVDYSNVNEKDKSIM